MTGGTTPVARIAKKLKDAQTIAICLPTQAPIDTVAAGLALYFALKKEDKSVSIATSGGINPQYKLVGQDQIANTIATGGDTLVVSIPYKDGGVDNVSYNVEGDRLNIHISPEDGREKFDETSVSYTYTGGKADVVVTLFAPTLKALGQLYENNKDQFEGTELINIDRHFTNSNYGTLNYVDKNSPSMSQMVNEIMKELKTDVDKEIASNLFDGLSAATQNLTAQTVDPQTLRMAAFLMEKGATRKADLGKAGLPETPQPKPLPTQPKSQPKAQNPTSQSAPSPLNQPAPTPPSPLSQNSPEEAPVEEQAPAERDARPEGTAESKEPDNPGSSQLKPQIFKGGSINKG